MKTARTLTAAFAAFTALVLVTPSVNATPTRELVGSFGHLEELQGIAIDQETGDVYVTEPRTDTVKIYDATGGAPVDGVPAEIKGREPNSNGVSNFHLDNDYPDGVAIDNSCYEHQPRLEGEACRQFDPSYGDVYVVTNHTNSVNGEPEGVDKFRLSHGDYELVEELIPSQETGSGAAGVTVDSRGDVYYTNYFSGAIHERKAARLESQASGEEVEIPGENIEVPQHIYEYDMGGIAMDGAGRLYVREAINNGGKIERGEIRLVLRAMGEVLSESVFAPQNEGGTHGGPRPVAIDRSRERVYNGFDDHVAEYSTAGALEMDFGSEEPAGGSLRSESAVTGIAVNENSGYVYVTNSTAGDVVVFGPVLAPPVVAADQPGASDVTQTSALLAGMANPEGGQGRYYYQYAAEGQYEPDGAEPYAEGGTTAIEALPSAHGEETVERIVISGLRPGTTYHYRLVVSNPSGTVYGPDQILTTAAATPPAVSTGAASEVSATGVTLSGTVDPRGLATSYVFEVGADASYGGAKLFGDAGEGTGEEHVTAALQFLVPGVTYHYRLVATSFDGASYGQDETFTTPSVAMAIDQPAATPELTVPTAQFPTLAGAIVPPARTVKAKRERHATGGLAAALRACRKRGRGGRTLEACEARARKAHRRNRKS